MENPIKYKTAATELGATKTRDKKYVDNAKQMTTDKKFNVLLISQPPVLNI